MTLSRQEIVDEVVKPKWREPILRVLAGGPKRWAELRNDLIALKTGAPGDGLINTELRKLKGLGLVENRRIEGAPHPGWALTTEGERVFTAIRKIFDEPTAPLKGLTFENMVERSMLIDTTTVHSARRYNYLLGGKDHFEVDRESGREIERLFPGVGVSVREGRKFLRRAVEFLAGEAGIDQFLDIGTGLPTADNTHEVAQRINPRSRVVYVDNDPMVMAHSRALLTSSPEGRTVYLEEDLRNPLRILGNPEVREVIDFRRPVALMLIAVVHFIEDNDEAYAIIRSLVDALPSGSYLAMLHFSTDTLPPELAADHARRTAEGKVDAFHRSKAQIAEFFAGLELVEPALQVASDWRSEVPERDRPRHQDVAGFGAVARKPGVGR